MKTELRKIPGVGEKTEQDLIALGYTTVDSLKGQDPEELYARECLLKGYPVDRRQLYIYRCAVYFAQTEHPDPEKLKWWNWKDAPGQGRVLILPAVQHSQIEKIGALAEEIWNEHYQSILSQEQIDYMVEKFQSVKAITVQMREEGYQYFLLELSDEDAGYMAIKVEEDRLFLSKLYLRKSARGQGVASEAMRYLENLCRQNGLSAIWLTVNKHNLGSIAVYEHLGFQKSYEQAADIGGGFVMDDHIMEKRIAALQPGP